MFFRESNFVSLKQEIMFICNLVLRNLYLPWRDYIRQIKINCNSCNYSIKFKYHSKIVIGDFQINARRVRVEEVVAVRLLAVSCNQSRPVSLCVASHCFSSQTLYCVHQILRHNQTSYLYISFVQNHCFFVNKTYQMNLI